eukprot:scaffold198979_cov93-Cyclotella_meneghiniana.AAC.1
MSPRTVNWRLRVVIATRVPGVFTTKNDYCCYGEFSRWLVWECPSGDSSECHYGHSGLSGSGGEGWR